MTKQADQPPSTPAGDQIMTAAREAADEVYPNAVGQTPSDHARRLSRRLCQVLADPTAWDKAEGQQA